MFSNQWFDACLQFFDLYIIKVIGISVKIGKNEPSRLQNDIQFIETVFESAPQALIALFVIITEIGNNNDISLVVLISFIFSISSIINRAVTQDSFVFKAWYVLYVLCKLFLNVFF